MHHLTIPTPFNEKLERCAFCMKIGLYFHIKNHFCLPRQRWFFNEISPWQSEKIPAVEVFIFKNTQICAIIRMINFNLSVRIGAKKCTFVPSYPTLRPVWSFFNKLHLFTLTLVKVNFYFLKYIENSRHIYLNVSVLLQYSSRL